MTSLINYLSGGKLPKDVIVDDLPFVFFEAYHLFLHNIGYEAYVFKSISGAIIPFCVKKSKLISNSYLLYPPIKNGSRLEVDEEEKVYEEFLNELRDRFKIDCLLPYVPIAVSKSAPARSENARFGCVSVNLQNSTEDELFAHFKSSNRNIIRKAIKTGATIIEGEGTFDAFYTVYSDTLKRQGLPCNEKKEIELLYQSLNGNCLCAVVYNEEGIPEGSILVPFTKFGGYSLFAGSVNNPEIRGAVKMLHWEIMKILKNKGVNKFILGGVRINENLDSKYIGMRDFKMSFGCSLEEGFLWKYKFSPLKVKMYKLAVQFKLKLKGQGYVSDVIEQINK